MLAHRLFVRFGWVFIFSAYVGLLGGAAFANPVLLLIDEDSIDNGNPPNFFSEEEINDHIAGLGVREPLPAFQNRMDESIILHTGEVGDAGWFAIPIVPQDWAEAGPTSDGIRNFLQAGPGLGTQGPGFGPEEFLDEIPDVTPLGTVAIQMLRSRQVCAVVYDSDISVNFGPLRGDLKGATLGIVAFEVAEVRPLLGFSSLSLPEVEILIRDATETCAGPLELFTDAPVPASSSEDPISVQENGVVNAASFSPVGTTAHAPAPGSLVSIFGVHFSANLFQAATIPLPTSLSGVSVSVNGKPAPLLFVSPWQINVQLPWDLESGDVDDEAAIVVTRDGASAESRRVQISPFSPAIFTFAFGSGPAVAINLDGSVSHPAGSIPGVPSRPARRGDTIVIFATGLGPVDFEVVDGENSDDRIRRTVTTPRVLVDGGSANVEFSGLSPEFVGVYQINATIPRDAQTGSEVPIQLSLGNLTSRADVTIAVQ